MTSERVLRVADEGFGVVVRPEAGQAVVAVRGEVDVASAARLRAAVNEAAGLGREVLAVDLSLVEFLDSTGLGVIVGALKRAHARGAELKLVRVPSQIFKVFEITGLTRVMSVELLPEP